MVRGSRTGSKEGDNDYTSWSVRAVANSANYKFPRKTDGSESWRCSQMVLTYEAGDPDGMEL